MTEKQAHKLYNEILSRVEELVGNKTTYLQDLENQGKKLLGVKFYGVYPSDKIPRLNCIKKYAILNLDKSTEAGSHWVAIAKDGETTLLYDSFGRCHKKIIPALSKSGNGKIINTDRDAEQHILETNCGARCLSFLILMDYAGSEIAKLI